MITAVRCAPAEARALLAGLKSNKTDSLDRVDLGGVIAQGVPFKLMQRGQAVGAFVLAGIGSSLWITAAAGRADIDLTAEIDAIVTGQAQAYEQIACRTERRGLVRKLLMLGYRIARHEGPSYFLRKHITP